MLSRKECANGCLANTQNNSEDRDESWRKTKTTGFPDLGRFGPDNHLYLSRVINLQSKNCSDC